jgi:hypothetical protein
MAAVAQRDLENRKVQICRVKLLDVLRKNREKHVAEYENAKRGYMTGLLAKLNQATVQARKDLEKRHAELLYKFERLTEDEIAGQQDSIELVEGSRVNMPVPRCYAASYDAAIAIAEWDERPILELSYAEFTCYVRDMWDWRSDFQAVTMSYMAG